MANDKSDNVALKEKLFSERKSSWLSYGPKKQEEIFEFSEHYKKFMAKSKTERNCIANIARILESNGFKDMDKIKGIKSGERAYRNIKGKSIIAFVAGRNKERLRILGGHIDSPRLDLKPCPLYEESDLAIVKTHYYGGIKKYQWANIPLELQGVVFTKDGKKVNVSLGEKDGLCFLIPDLLPHLSVKQLDKKAKEFIEGEQLSIVVGNIPVDDDEIKEKVKLNVLKLLNERFGIVEEDFNCAELELVPMHNPIDTGIDRSMVAAYGHDAKSCAYASLRALLSVSRPNETAVAFFADKEEIGSVGDTGAASFILQNFAYDYRRIAGIKKNVSEIFCSSKAISADVTSAMDPNFKDVFDSRNVSFMGRGVSIEKYGGSGGKFYSHDTHAEYMAYIRGILDKKKIPWQTGEMGRVDLGGGGTISMFLSRYGMDCVDAGPCVLGMHSPFEIISKADLYSSYLLYRAFFND